MAFQKKRLTIMQKVENRDCIKAMQNLEPESIDIILTDPPYKYLKNQKLESDFDEKIFFKEAGRVLKKGGFLVFFGRGTSFYRWNYITGELKDDKEKSIFEFKEEFIWDKGYCSSPLLAVSRVHETVAIYSKGKGKINRVKVPYLEMRKYDLKRIQDDIKRLNSLHVNPKSLQSVLRYLENQEKPYSEDKKTSTGISSVVGGRDRKLATMIAFEEGMNEKSIIREDLEWTETSTNYKATKSKETKTGDRCVNVINSICQDMNEKTIIKQGRDHYGTIHPTQKPVEFLKRLLNLVIKSENDLILDPFSGSCSTGVACKELGLNFLGYEIDEEYFQLGNKRLEEHKIDLKLI